MKKNYLAIIAENEADEAYLKDTLAGESGLVATYESAPVWMTKDTVGVVIRRKKKVDDA
jgi:hypothetical protein